MTVLLAIFDIALALGFTLRLVRLVIADDIGYYLIQRPVNRWHVRRAGPGRARAFWINGLTCPFCVGFWLACLVLLSLFVAGGPGSSADTGTLLVIWRWVAGAFTLNWLAAHIGAALGDND